MKLLCMHCGCWVSEELSVNCDCGTFCSKACVDLAHDKFKQVKHHLDALSALGCEINIKGLAHEGIFLDIESEKDKPIPYSVIKASYFGGRTEIKDAIRTPRKTNRSN